MQWALNRPPATSGSLIIDYIDRLLEEDGQVSAAVVSVIMALSPFQMNMCPAKVEVGVYQCWKEKKDVGQSGQFSHERLSLLYLTQLLWFNTSSNAEDLVCVFIPGWLHRMNVKCVNIYHHSLLKWSLCAAVRLLLIPGGLVCIVKSGNVWHTVYVLCVWLNSCVLIHLLLQPINMFAPKHFFFG